MSHASRSIAEWLRWGGTQVADPAEAEVLLAHALGESRSFLRAWPELVPEDRAASRYGTLLARRRLGEPVAYLTGRREFWSLPLEVTSDTLIPRPETELLVELALERIPRDAGARLADLGCGSGAVALALATERPGCRVVAVDSSWRALQVARRNALRLKTGNVSFLGGDWCDALAERAFEMIVSNPPYVNRTDPHLHQGDLPHEPLEALSPGADGLSAISAIVAQAHTRLRPGGWLVLEHGFDQAERVRSLLVTRGYAEVRTHRDLAGLERATVGRCGVSRAESC